MAYRFLQYCRSAERVHEYRRQGRGIPLPEGACWRSRLLYDFRRNLEPTAESARQKADLDWLRDLLPLTVDPKPVAPVILGVMYALYLNRGA